MSQDDFKLSEFKKKTPSLIQLRVALPYYTVQYLECYARYVYDARGVHYSIHDVVQEAMHQFLKKLLKHLAINNQYKLPNYHMKYRRPNRKRPLEPVKLVFNYTNYKHLRDAIKCNYIYFEFGRPCFSDCVREAIEQHMSNHRKVVNAYLSGVGWDVE